MNVTALSSDNFQQRHLGPGPDDRQHMLETIGVRSLDELIDRTIPASIRRKDPLRAPAPMSEHRYLEHLSAIAAKNAVRKSFLGQGYYGTVTPGVIRRNIFENPGWYTQYTPYQPEIAQGRLEALLNYQTMVSDLTGMDVANASLLDEGTAAAESVAMAANIVHKNPAGERRKKIFVSHGVFRQTLDVIRTRAIPLGIEVVTGDERTASFDETTIGAVLQYPAQDGAVLDPRPAIEAVHRAGGIAIVATDLLALTLLTPPGEMGADVVVGNSQRFGIPMGYGGPHAAFFATKNEYLRLLPGRIIGVSVDAHQATAFRMALQTREQHIRREKATSNICTAQALLAIMAGMYGVHHGPEGLRAMAQRIRGLAAVLDGDLRKLGYVQLNAVYFDTLHIDAESPSLADAIMAEADRTGINLRRIDRTHIGIALDETTEPEDVEAIRTVFASAARKDAPLVSVDDRVRTAASALPASFARASLYLTHPVFHLHRSESELMRYIKRLENKDLSLMHSMIPLGSCTMKLNAAAELLPVTWPAFANLHPFAPVSQAAGYREIFESIDRMLCDATGFAGCSLQPNSGAQGEFAGLLVIRAYHHDRGDTHRNVALIPSSAHGTNPASAVMTGMQVVVVACDARGNIDVADLRAKAAETKDRLAALMVTYPSTHGVFEEDIREICGIVHANGGQVYMDGANMNAQVGLTSPALIGADVCHINLHKTFAIPHGGGGPGMGPICVANHLVPYLPGHSVVGLGGPKAIPAVSSAPWGSASILLISYGYMRMLGGWGMTEATRYAILNANYLKKRLEGTYAVLYQGDHGHVGHEFILNMKAFKDSAGVEVSDIAKRLMDYGFHAPTVSFPVHDTLMIEPTESESKAELDRFASALLSIREEIREIEEGTADRKDNVLKNAPHTALQVTADDWKHPYSRSQAAYPLPYVRDRKFWPSVGRINDTYGDRNIVCACPPIEQYSTVGS
jgi:glycine dehydrogenase